LKLFVWDFHGVLERGNDLAVQEISNLALASHGYTKRISLEECEQLAGLKWGDYFAALFPELSPHSHAALYASCLEISKTKPELICKYLSLNEHAYYVLEEIQKSPYTQILISNTQAKVLDWFLARLELERFFPLNHRFGVEAHDQYQTKQECLKDYLSMHAFPEGVVTIGDSPGDMQLAGLHPKSVGYMYTYPGRYHRDADCHYKINDLRHVLKEVEDSARLLV
jgi:phosphoglycolate phosphatase-like HAD superfamily hydrolase